MTRRVQMPRIGSTGIRANRMAQGGRVRSESRIKRVRPIIGDAGLDPCTATVGESYPHIYMPVPSSVSVDGFGYVIPRAEGMPFIEPNGEYALGQVQGGYLYAGDYYSQAIEPVSLGAGIVSSHSYKFGPFQGPYGRMLVMSNACGTYVGPDWRTASYIEAGCWMMWDTIPETDFNQSIGFSLGYEYTHGTSIALRANKQYSVSSLPINDPNAYKTHWFMYGGPDLPCTYEPWGPMRPVYLGLRWNINSNMITATINSSSYVVSGTDIGVEPPSGPPIMSENYLSAYATAGRSGIQSSLWVDGLHIDCDATWNYPPA